MPILSNGQMLEISSERARYHATRLMLNISRETPHEDLYALVDVVLAKTRHGNIHYPSGYLFSGHTLADTDWWYALNKTGQQKLLAWLGESHVRYEIEGARRRLIYDDLPATIIDHPYPDKLYSNFTVPPGCDAGDQFTG